MFYLLKHLASISVNHDGKVFWINWSSSFDICDGCIGTIGCCRGRIDVVWSIDVESVVDFFGNIGLSRQPVAYS